MRATRVGVAVAFLACVVFETWAVMPMVAGTGGGSLVLRNDTTLWQWGFTPGGTYYLPEPVVAAGRSAPIRGVSWPYQ